MRLTINGSSYEADVEPEMPLLWVLRDELGLTGTKFGCGVGICGACSIHLDGQVVRSCVLPVSAAAQRTITTIEGLTGKGAELQAAWVANQVPQCGYCQSGMLMAAADLLVRIPHPDAAAIDAGITNICRCGTYARVKEAVLRIANSDSPSPAPRENSPQAG